MAVVLSQEQTVNARSVLAEGIYQLKGKEDVLVVVDAELKLELIGSVLIVEVEVKFKRNQLI